MYGSNANPYTLTSWLRLAQKAIPHDLDVTLIIRIIQLQVESSDDHSQRHVELSVCEPRK